MNIPIEQVAMMYFKMALEREALIEENAKLKQQIERGQNGGATKDRKDNKPELVRSPGTAD